METTTYDTMAREYDRSTGLTPIPTSYENRICDTIREGRRSLRMTQRQLADVLGVSQQTVSKWESRRALPDVAMFPLIAETLELPNFGSVNLADLPRWDHLPDMPFRGEIGRFRHIVELRDVPWLMPVELCANPLNVDAGGWVPYRDQAVYETTRILTDTMGLEVYQTNHLMHILWIISCVPGGSIEDIPVFFWSEAARRHMMAFACTAVGSLSHEQAVKRLFARDDIEDRADAMLSALSPVLDNPYVIRRLSSIHNIKASYEAMLRERETRREYLSMEDNYEGEALATHADRIATWDGRHDCSRPTIAEILPTTLYQLAREKLARGQSQQAVVAEFRDHPDDVMEELRQTTYGARLIPLVCGDPTTNGAYATERKETITYIRNHIGDCVSAIAGWDVAKMLQPCQVSPFDDPFDDLLDDLIVDLPDNQTDGWLDD